MFLTLLHTVHFRQNHPIPPSTDVKGDLFHTAEYVSVIGKKIIVMLF